MLTVITGPMFSGKTEELISMAMAHVFAGHYIMGFKPAIDNRYDDFDIKSHAGASFPARPINQSRPDDIYSTIINHQMTVDKRIDVVLIDEAQFFQPKQLFEEVEKLLYEHEFTVIISGLSQDFEGKPFGAMPQLLAIADDIIHKKAVCAASKRIGAATRTYRKDIGNKEQVAIGGADMYEPRSFETWLESRKIM